MINQTTSRMVCMPRTTPSNQKMLTAPESPASRLAAAASPPLALNTTIKMMMSAVSQPRIPLIVLRSEAPDSWAAETESNRASSVFVDSEG